MSDEARSEDIDLEELPDLLERLRDWQQWEKTGHNHDVLKETIAAVEALRERVASQEKRYKLYQHIAKSIQHALHGKDVQKDILEVFDETITRANAAEARVVELAEALEGLLKHFDPETGYVCSRELATENDWKVARAVLKKAGP